jgi:hypothetical protein
MRWPWNRSKALEEADEAVRAAEELRDGAEAQQRRVEALGKHVDATADRLRQLRTDNHFGPLVESILRGNK